MEPVDLHRPQVLAEATHTFVVATAVLVALFVYVPEVVLQEQAAPEELETVRTAGAGTRVVVVAVAAVAVLQPFVGVVVILHLRWADRGVVVALHAILQAAEAVMAVSGPMVE